MKKSIIIALSLLMGLPAGAQADRGGEVAKNLAVF